MKIKSFLLALFLILPFGAVCSEKILFSEKVIIDSIDKVENGLSYPFGHQVYDIDNDGDLDFTVVDVFTDSRFLTPKGAEVSILFWVENQGNGNFKRHLITADLGFLERHRIGDVNNDGNIDVIIGNNRDGGVNWYEGLGARASSGHLWERHKISISDENMPRVYDLETGDLDNDGDIDIAVAGYTGGHVVLLENPGPQNIHDPWNQYIIAEKMPYVRTLNLVDIDNDGFLDILAGSEGNPVSKVPLHEKDPKHHGAYLRWIKNPGYFPKDLFTSITHDDEFRWKIRDIDTATRAVGHSAYADMDGDGDTDVVTTFGMRSNLIPLKHHHVAWYENNSDGDFWVKHHISNIDHAFDLAVGDINGDKFLDVVVSGHAIKGHITVLEQTPSGWSKTLLKADITAVNQIHLSDFDNDGDLDITTTSDNGNGDISMRRGNQQSLRLFVNEF